MLKKQKMNYKKSNNIYFVFIFVVVTTWMSFSLPVFASTLSWQEIKNNNPKQLIFVLRLTTNGNERENAWSGQIKFDPRQMKLQTLSDARSLMSLWLERPHETSVGQIDFSGITPGGFAGSGEVFRLIFNLPLAGSVVSARDSLRVASFDAWLGNGLGQKAKTIILSQISLITADSDLTDLSLDQTAPELIWQITSDNLISLFASDKQSGINYLALATTSKYFVLGDLYKINQETSWQKITSPEILTSATLRHVVLLKAVDNAGNVKLVKLYPIKVYLLGLICIIIIVLLLFLFL